jgi:hypothetical protein
MRGDVPSCKCVARRRRMSAPFESKNSPQVLAVTEFYCGQLPGGVGPKVGFERLLVAGPPALRL